MRAKGVETVEQFRVLKDKDCNEVHGDLFSPSVTADEGAIVCATGQSMDTALPPAHSLPHRRQLFAF